MSEVIIYKGSDGVSVLYPADKELSVKDIGRKDVPEGLPFWIIEGSQLEGLVVDAIEIDDSSYQPDGYGEGYNANKNK